MQLLCHCWQNDGKIPNNERVLSRLSELSGEDLKTVLKLFQIRGEFIRHKRLEMERQKQDAFRQKQSKNGKKGGRGNKSETQQPTDTANKKGSALSGKSQTKAKKRSSSPTSTSSPTSNTDTSNAKALGKPNKKDEQVKNICERAVKYLNDKAGKKFHHNSARTLKSVSARVNEGYTSVDFKVVIDNMCYNWLENREDDNKDMSQYLRPSTLFGPKFEDYLNALPNSKAADDVTSEADRILKQ